MGSIGGLDPLADAYNLMGAQGMMGPNPYLEYTGKIPMAGYRGTPTDAMGNPIQSFLDAQNQYNAWNAANPTPAASPQGTTLNTPPPVHGVGGLQQGQYDDKTGLPAGQPMQFALASQPNGMPQGWNQNSNNGGLFITQPSTPYHPQQQQAPAATPAPQNPIDMRQAYLDALSNPGKVNTPGAQIYPGAQQTGAPQPSVLAQFLNQQGGRTGAGGYTNQPFFNTLNQLQSARGATS